MLSLPNNTIFCLGFHDVTGDSFAKAIYHSTTIGILHATFTFCMWALCYGLTAYMAVEGVFAWFQRGRADGIAILTAVWNMWAIAFTVPCVVLWLLHNYASTLGIPPFFIWFGGMSLLSLRTTWIGRDTIRLLYYWITTGHAVAAEPDLAMRTFRNVLEMDWPIVVGAISLTSIDYFGVYPCYFYKFCGFIFPVLMWLNDITLLFQCKGIGISGVLFAIADIREFFLDDRRVWMRQGPIEVMDINNLQVQGSSEMTLEEYQKALKRVEEKIKNLGILWNKILFDAKKHNTRITQGCIYRHQDEVLRFRREKEIIEGKIRNLVGSSWSSVPEMDIRDGIVQSKQPDVYEQYAMRYEHTYRYNVWCKPTILVLLNTYYRIQENCEEELDEYINDPPSFATHIRETERVAGRVAAIERWCDYIHDRIEIDHSEFFELEEEIIHSLGVVNVEMAYDKHGVVSANDIESTQEYIKEIDRCHKYRPLTNREKRFCACNSKKCVDAYFSVPHFEPMLLNGVEVEFGFDPNMSSRPQYETFVNNNREILEAFAERPVGTLNTLNEFLSREGLNPAFQIRSSATPVFDISSLKLQGKYGGIKPGGLREYLSDFSVWSGAGGDSPEVVSLDEVISEIEEKEEIPVTAGVFGQSLISDMAGGTPPGSRRNSVANDDSSPEGQIELMKELLGDSDLGQFIINLATSLISVSKCMDVTMVINQLIMLLNNTKLGSHARKFIFQHIQKLNQYCFNVQGDDKEPSMSELLTSVDFGALMTKNPVFAQLWDIISCFSISSVLDKMGLFSNNTVGWLKNELAPLMAKDMFDTFLRKCWRFMYNLVRRVIRAITERDWKILLGTTYEPGEWIGICETICDDERIKIDTRPSCKRQFHEARERGEIHEFFVSPMTEKERSEAMLYLISVGETFMNRTFLTQEKSFEVTVRHMLARLRQESFKITNAKRNGQYRAEPFGVFIFGAAGCGKSSIIQAVTSTCLKARGLPCGPESVYVMMQKSNFMDGLTPEHTAVIMDDLDQNPQKPAYADVTFVDSVIDLINTKPTQIEQADVANKGKLFANFQMVMFLTNYSESQIDGKIVDKLVFWRRFPVKVFMKVKKEFSDEHGKLKAGISSENNNLWDFEIYVYDTKNFDGKDLGKQVPYRLYKTFKSTIGFLAEMRSLFVEHMKFQDLMLVKMSKYSSEFCDHCGCSVVLHPFSRPCLGPGLVDIWEQNEREKEANLGVDISQAQVQSDEPFWFTQSYFEKAAVESIKNSISLFIFGWLFAGLCWLWWFSYYFSAYILVLFCLFLIKTKDFWYENERVFRMIVYRFFVKMRISDFGFADAALYWMYGLKTRDFQLKYSLKSNTCLREVLEQSLEMKKKTLQFILGVIASLFTAYAGYRAYKYITAEGKVTMDISKRESQAFVTEEVTIKNNSIGVDERQWVSVPAKATPSEQVIRLDTTSIEQLIEAVKHRCVRVKNLANEREMNGNLILSNYIIFPSHIFGSAKNLTGRQLDINSFQGKIFDLEIRHKLDRHVIKVTVGTNGNFVPGRDLFVLFCSTLFPLSVELGRKHIPIQSFSGLHSCASAGVAVIPKWFDEKEKKMPEFRVVELDAHVPQYFVPHDDRNGNKWIRYSTTSQGFESGDCGTLILMRINAEVFIGGSHSFVLDTKSGGLPWYCAEELVMTEIDTVIKGLSFPSMELPGVTVQCWQGSKKWAEGDYDQDLQIADLPKKSSVATALAEVPLDVIGTLKEPIALSTMKTKVKKNITFDKLQEFEFAVLGKNGNFEAPIFKGRMMEADEKLKIMLNRDEVWRDPYVVSLINCSNVGGDPAIWNVCVEDVCDGIEKLGGREFVKPLTLVEAIVGNEFGTIKPLNLKTSTGLPQCKPKTKFIKKNGETIEIENWILEEIAYIEKVIDSGSLFVPFCAHTMKDEVISPEKNKDCAVRIFNTVPIAFNILLKMYLAPIQQFMMAHREFFENSAGVNICSDDLDNLISFIVNKGEKIRMFNGDFKWFDNKQSSNSKIAEAEVWRRVALALPNYSERDVKFVYLLVLSLIYTIRFIKNDLIRMTGKTVSGALSTLIGNCINNMLSMRYCYYAEYKERKQIVVLVYNPEINFRLAVALSTVGDDNLGGVAKWCDWFNQEILQRRMPEIGHMYVHPDKSKRHLKMPEWTPWEELTFLKRCFRWSDDLSRWVAPIEKKTIVKMALWHVESELTPLDHNAVLLGNALREAFLWGREFFEYCRNEFDKAAHATDVHLSGYYHLYTYEELMDKVFKNTFMTWDVPVPEIVEMDISATLIRVEDVYSVPEQSTVQVMDITNITVQSKSLMCSCGLKQLFCATSIPVDQVARTVEAVDKTIIDAKSVPVMDVTGLKVQCKFNFGAVEIDYDDLILSRFPIMNIRDFLEVQSTEGNITTMHMDETVAEGDVATIEGTTEMEVVNVDAATKVDTAPNPNDLDKFLCRWTRVGTYTMSSADASGAKIATNIDLANTYFSDPVISQKLSNYYSLRFDLEVTIVESCGASQYGKYIATFHSNPYPSAQAGVTNALGGPGMYNCTQGIHANLECSRSNSALVHLPWVSQWDSMIISSQYSGAPRWLFNIICIVPIKDTINYAAATSASVDVYVRVKEGYRLGAPTVQGKDKGGTKWSAMAKKGSEIAGMASLIPGIGELAAPVAAGLAAAGDVLDFFGFTRKSNPTEPNKVTREHFSNLAVIDGMDTSVPLSLTNGNSVTIDPTTAGGTSEDIMSFASLMKRQTIIFIGTWAETDAKDHIIKQWPVMPGYVNSSAGSYDASLPFYIGLPFMFWRGSMEYEIEVVCSSFHRGKLQLLWFPTNATPTYDATNETWNCIFDITAGTKKKFKIGWAVPQPCLGNNINASPTTGMNGFLCLRVHTPLKTMGTGTSVGVIIKVNGGDDLRFGVPRAACDTSGTVDFQSIVTVQAGQIGDKPMEDEVCILGGDFGEYPLAATMWGEEILSVRALMQKFSAINGGYIMCDYAPAATQSRHFTADFPFFYPVPFNSGQQQVTVYVNSAATVSVNREKAKWTWFGYYSALFNGIRGGMRVKGIVVPWQITTSTSYYPNPASVLKSLSIYQYNGPTKSTSVGSLYGPDYVVSSSILAGQVFCEKMSQGFEFQLPYSYPYKFFNPTLDYTTSTAIQRICVEAQFWADSDIAGAPRIPIYLYVGGSSDITAVSFFYAPRVILGGSGTMNTNF